MNRAERRRRHRLKAKDGTVLQIQESLTKTCPCGQRVTVGYEGDDRHPVVLHPVPTCAYYDRRGVIEYVTWAPSQDGRLFPWGGLLNDSTTLPGPRAATPQRTH